MLPDFHVASVLWLIVSGGHMQPFENLFSFSACLLFADRVDFPPNSLNSFTKPVASAWKMDGCTM